ncbi:hypothetical protein VNO77_33816 [Canavalia gladiata]|uniref:Uncharacterized protein n=1 Tax=Canavalia gladiata TaxID=3824 RepID=A0AAN9KFL2_CANGL
MSCLLGDLSGDFVFLYWILNGAWDTFLLLASTEINGNLKVSVFKTTNLSLFVARLRDFDRNVDAFNPWNFYYMLHSLNQFAEPRDVPAGP